MRAVLQNFMNGLPPLYHKNYWNNMNWVLRSFLFSEVLSSELLFSHIFFFSRPVFLLLCGLLSFNTDPIVLQVSNSSCDSDLGDNPCFIFRIVLFNLTSSLLHSDPWKAIWTLALKRSLFNARLNSPVWLK